MYDTLRRVWSYRRVQLAGGIRIFQVGIDSEAQKATYYGGDLAFSVLRDRRAE